MVNSSVAPCAARRAMLLALGSAGVVTLAGCGGEEPAAKDPGAGGAASSPGVASPAPSESIIDDRSLPPWPSGDGLVATGEVPVGGAVLVRDSILVSQPSKGVFKAFDATCPHQGITVEPPVDTGRPFMCPGHNSTFKLADGGRISGPAPRGLKAIPVKVKDGYVVEV